MGQNDDTFDPELNKAIARELYVEDTINVVNPTNRKSPNKVKPGQMNLFNPLPKYRSQALNEVYENQETPGVGQPQRDRSAIDMISDIFKDQSGGGVMRN